MLHQYGGGGGHQSVTGRHGTMAAASTFSLFFPLPTGGQSVEEEPCYSYSYDDHGGSSTFTASASPSSSSSSAGTVVDCTLSLGTPSSRRAQPVPGAAPPTPPYPSAALSCWDAAAESCYYQQGKPTAAGTGAACRGAAGHVDQFLDRRCANCGTSTTPLWRNGPRGPKSLCNACGIRFKKEERRAAETGAGCGYITQNQRAPRVGVAVSRGEALHRHAEADAPFLAAAWRLNAVPPAPAFSAPWTERASCVFQHN